jgi:hypothetical protein
MFALASAIAAPKTKETGFGHREKVIGKESLKDTFQENGRRLLRHL